MGKLAIMSNVPSLTS